MAASEQKFAGYFLDVLGGILMIIGGEPAVTAFAHNEIDRAFGIYVTVFSSGLLLVLVGFFWSRIQPQLWPNFSLIWVKTSDRCARALGISRAEYIRRAIENMNRESDARARAARLAEASRKVRKESMRVNVEFAAIEREPDA